MEPRDFLIVGIGASAGGIQAIRRFFEHVPAGSGIAYVVILHLSPEHESHLAEVLQISSSIPVTQVQQQVRVEPDHVYVIPPHRSLAMAAGDLMLSEMTRFEERRAPVDIFFRTLAESHHERAVAVVLSGTGANGSMGIKRIKEFGGICLVQDPDEAEYGDMPRNSIATSLVDHIMAVAEMPERIIAYRDSLETVKLPDGPSDRAVSEEHALRDIFVQLRSRTGHDFSNYKPATMLRRIARRMGIHQVANVSRYAHYVSDHPEESQALLKDLLISVTNFFRDREAFDILERLVVPKLFAGKGEDDQVRVWVAGCATGEEAYSLTMLLAEHAAAMPGSPSVQVFATDLDQAAIAVAREGVYTLNDAADVAPERLRRFFAKQGRTYRVGKELREMILFAHHNIIKDPPFSHLDLVSCRNLLIYLNRSAQRRVMEVMHFALNAGSYLFLGSSESVEDSGDLFVAYEKDAYLFQSRAVSARLALPVPELSMPGRGDTRSLEKHASEPRVPEKLSAADLHQRLLEQYAPPSIVINEEHDIVHLSERAGMFLHYAGGEPSVNLLKAVRPELRIELRTALYQAAQQRRSVEARGLVLRLGDRTISLNLTVRPVLREEDTARGFFVVLFQETADAIDPPAAAAPLSSSDTARQLEDEVQRVKAQLRATIERHETQAEELKASNEELQAMNEELRSSAEELETSKEELQSLNEELRTVNQELKIKVEEQAQANDDIQNLINSTEIGTIFLDRRSRIKLFTPRARDIFTLIPADRGRPLSDISSTLVDADLRTDIKRVMDRLERVEREVKTQDDRWQLMRILPYRTAGDRIDGVVLTFVDITHRRLVEEQVQRSEARLRLILESATDYAILTTDADGHIDGWNTGAARMYGYTEDEAIGRPAAQLFTPEDRDRHVPEQEMRASETEGHAPDERWHLRKDGTRFFASGVIVPLRDRDGTVTGFAKIARDLTERKRWEDQLRDAHMELENRVVQRTGELAAANAALDAELRERRVVEEQIRTLLRRVITVQEDERRRIARDLHDHLGQQLAGLGLTIEAIAQLAGSSSDLAAPAERARRVVETLDRDLDFFTWQMRAAPLDDLGLVPALGKFVREWSANFAIPADYQPNGLDGLSIPYDVENNLYRIAQEALNNVYKHAQATRAGVLLERRDGQVVLLIEDDGRGFDPAARSVHGDDTGIGLLGMRERAAVIGGTFDLETAPGRGTTVFVQVPVPAALPAPGS